MSNNLKPLTAQVAEQLIAQFNEGSSLFQRKGNVPLMIPFNPTTGKNYRGAVALVLLMKQMPDPRWMSLKQASFQKWPVKKDEHGTLISFYKSSEIRPARAENGEPELKENGKPKVVSVQLAEPELITAFLFNGSQLKDFPAPAARLEIPATERARRIITNSGVRIEHGGNVIFYDREKDLIHLPEPESFPSEAKYYAAVFCEMSEWWDHKSQLTLPSADAAQETLRHQIAAVLISAELALPYELLDTDCLAAWSELLKKEPSELFKAASNAQKTVDYLLLLEKIETAQQQAPAEILKGDVIPYKGESFRILAILKGKTLQVQTGEGKKFKVSPDDRLYAALVEAKNKQGEKKPTMGSAIDLPAQADENEDRTYLMAR